jgi:hypothetical protein
MQKAKQLREIVAEIDRFDGGDTIYCRAPWTNEADALVATEPDGGGLPEEAERLGFSYFLEIDIAKDLARNLADQGATSEAICTRIVAYAVNDA